MPVSNSNLSVQIILAFNSVQKCLEMNVLLLLLGQSLYSTG